MESSGIRARFYFSYEGFALNVQVSLPGSGVTAIFGPSGSGKTTFLRCVAGLTRPPLGFLSVQGDIWQNENRFVPVHKRSIGYVFQEPSLFPHLSARGNLAYALKRREKRGLALDIDFDEVVSLLELGSLLGRMPEALSGGERQRVAIARALLVGPKLLLMDEPLASLDRARKHEILPYLDRLKEELMLPILYVSHSVEEVQRLADHLVVLEEGRCVYNGPFMKGLIHSEFPLSSERLRLIEPS